MAGAHFSLWDSLNIPTFCPLLITTSPACLCKQQGDPLTTCLRSTLYNMYAPPLTMLSKIASKVLCSAPCTAPILRKKSRQPCRKTPIANRVVISLHICRRVTANRINTGAAYVIKYLCLSVNCPRVENQ